MIITHVDDTENIRYAYLNLFPDQFKTEKEKKENKAWIRNTMDYFANVAYAQYRKHRDTFVKNYDLMKGKIDHEDFYGCQEVQSFTDTLMEDTELPGYVKHYPILNPPVNTMIGELTKRPDLRKVRAFDDDSRSEELEYKTQITQKLIMQKAMESIQAKMAMDGADPSQLEEGEFDKMVLEKVNDYMTSYTSLGESWGNHVITALKMQFNLKEKSEDAYRDLLISSREFFHIYEDNSKTGFNVEVLNPKNQWQLGTPDAKYTSGVSGDQNVPYAAGTVQVMEISEIIEKFPDLTEEEITHLRTSLQDYGLINVRESNLSSGKVGPDSIVYDTYNRALLEERMMVEAEMKENKDELRDWLGLSNSVSSFGYKYTVVRAYWVSKMKVGLLSYLDEQGEPQKMLVDENYKKIPNEISITWGWVNQWYQGTKIGPDIFHVKPFKLLNYCPIIGVIHEIKNTTAKSLVDLMKPFQMLYNICMNQLFSLLEKEIGNVGSVSIRRIPRVKDGDAQDDIDMWESDARRRGFIFDDDSMENTKGGVSNQSVARNVDLTRSSEIQSRYNLAIQLKNECWELIGMNRQRLGGALATETATANQNALVQSFAQTEPYFAAHDYVLDQLYQGILDAAQYVESNKPSSTISYITNQGESAFIEVTQDDIKLKDLKIFVTSRPEDQQLLNQFRQLSQPMLQNGASVYDISTLYTTNSIRQMQKIFKDLKEKQDAMASQQQQIEQQQLQIDQQKAAAEIEQKERHHEDEMKIRKYDIDTKANTALATAEIKNYFQMPDADTDNNGVPDPVDIANHALKLQESINKTNLENKKLSQDMAKHMDDQKNKKKQFDLDQQKLDIERKKLKSKNTKK